MRCNASSSASNDGNEGDEALGAALLADVAGGGKLVVAALRASSSSAASAGASAVPSSALLGQQMQRLQAETHSRVTPLLSELDSSGRQTAALQARREALSRELRAVKADLAAAGARSQALQASADEAQDLYERSLQALLATHTPAPAATVPDPAAAEALAETAASLEALVADLLGNVRRVESAMGTAFRPPAVPQPQTQTPALSAASSAALAQQVSGRVSASAAALADYVEAEGRCLWALAERVARGRDRLQALRAEESAFRGLNMQVRRSITSRQVASRISYRHCSRHLSYLMRYDLHRDTRKHF